MARYEDSVFVNCPFDDDYKPIHDAIIFTIFSCGFVPRSALEADNSAEVRISKISNIIKESKFGIHDISRTELDDDSDLPRFNMPLELGMFLGAQQLGTTKQRRKSALILDRERYRYQKYISDISGQDIKSHSDVADKAIKVVRNWLNSQLEDGDLIPGAHMVKNEYELFSDELPVICENMGLEQNELTFRDYTTLVSMWLQDLRGQPLVA